MRVPLSWLREYVDFDLEPAALAEQLTRLGMEVQSIDRIGGDWQSIVVGELVEVRPHPAAERLSLTRVRVADDGQPLSIVCGATNIAVGQRVPVALPGALLPGGRRIGVSTIQGEESQGMLCSGDELGLTADADGILILSDGAAENPPAVGRRLEELVADVVLDIDVKPNRGDLLSLIGLAREVAAIGGGRVRWPDITVPETGDDTADHVHVEIENERLCPRFVGRFVDGLSTARSPVSVQLRLSAAGMRPVSNVVDASNYVMLELGKPIHTFDAAALEEGRIIVRPAREGEVIETLDHVRRELTPQTLLIADPRGPLGIAGVMGGADSEIGPETTAVIIESAVFDPVSIRRTAQRFGLRSEASLRFEKGQESRLARLGADRTAQLLAAWAGGRPAVGVVDTNPEAEPPRRVPFRPSRVSRLLGEPIEPAEMRELLERVEIDTQPFGGDDWLRTMEGQPPVALDEHDASEVLVAVVPAHRRDVAIEADVSEEVCRLRGYERLAPRLPDTEMPGYRADPRRLPDMVCDLLGGRGLSEVVTNGLISAQDHARLGYLPDDPATIRVANPVAADHSEMRRSLLPGLVRVLATNERQRRTDLAIFELGPIHAFVESEPWQANRLGILLAGPWVGPSWTQPSRQVDVEDAKGIVEVLADRLGVDDVVYRVVDPEPMVEHPGRTAGVFATHEGEPVMLGRVGEFDPRYLAACDVRSERAVFAVLDGDLLARLAGSAVQVGRLAHLPALERDVAVVVRRDVPQAEVATVIREAAGPLLNRLALFDRYHGAPLDPSELSLAYRLRFQPVDQAVADTELEETMAGVTRALADRLGARVRGAGDAD
jgi:phenylalanyl-tRNA synthetase beta chain